MIYLVLVIAILCILIGWMDYNNRKERKDLINAIKAKDAVELANLQLADKTEIKVKPEKEPDLVELSNLSDDEFNKAINA